MVTYYCFSLVFLTSIFIILVTPYIQSSYQILEWTLQDLNLGPTDYESVALTN